MSERSSRERELCRTRLSIMTSATASRSARLFALAAACAAIVAIVLISFRATSDPRSELVAGHLARQGWKTIEHQGVRVDIPAAWVRPDMSGCGAGYERWAPPSSRPCDFGTGLAINGSALFDPAYGPGVRRSTANGAGAAVWDGWAYAGDFVVSASDADRQVVQAVLDSVRVTGSPAPRVR